MGGQLQLALEEARKKGIIPLDREEAQNPCDSRDNRSGREEKALINQDVQKEDSMEQVQTNGTQDARPTPKTTDEAMSVIAVELGRFAHNWNQANSQCKPIAAVASVTPLPRLALESAVRYGIAGAIAAGVAAGLRFTVFRKAL